MQRQLKYASVGSGRAGRVKVALYGIGAIGIAVARAALGRRSLEVVGALDRDPHKVGRDLGELIGGGRTGIAVTDRSDALAGAEVVVHTTGSSFQAVYSQLAEIVEAGANVVSSCEELAFPYLQNPDLSGELNGLANRKRVTVFGTGVNPGFVMDALPVAVSGVVSDVRRVAVTRVVDATTRRGPLQKKIGSGMTPEAFEALAQQGKIGHVGLVESVALIAHCLGWPLEAVAETLDPVVTQEAIRTEHVQVAPGQVAGLHQTAAGLQGGRKVIEMDLTMRLKAPDARDEILVEGTPAVRLVIPGGTAGDPATVAALLNAVPRVLDAPPGLLTARDLLLPRGVG